MLNPDKHVTVHGNESEIVCNCMWFWVNNCLSLWFCITPPPAPTPRPPKASWLKTIATAKPKKLVFSISIYDGNLVFRSMCQYFILFIYLVLEITFPLDYSNIFIYSTNYCDVAMGGVWNDNISSPASFFNFPFITFILHISLRTL